MTIAVINCGIGNCGSVVKMLSLFTDNVSIVDQPAMLKHVKKIVLPGVGSFDQAMRELETNGFRDVLNHLVLYKKIPILGICLGMQLLCESSEEGVKEGLKWIPAHFAKFDRNNNKTIKIPHMGWNVVNLKKNNPLLKDMHEDARFYFAHSFYMDIQSEVTVGVTPHGCSFSSVIMKDNIYGVQFHPEKSHKFGKLLMKNFVEL